MTELERRALLGDKQAQEECSERKITLPCPLCGGQADIVVQKDAGLIICKRCKLYKPFTIVLDGANKARSVWNTRPAPSIGRCGECEHWYKGHCSTGPCATEETDADFYCSNFKQDTKQGLSKQRDKEREENAAD